MSPRPIDDKIRELLDGHQPTDASSYQDDPNIDPELASWLSEDAANQAVWRQLQKVDRAIGLTTHSVPTPVGLADRLKARLAHDGSGTRVDEEALKGDSQSLDLTPCLQEDASASGSSNVELSSTVESQSGNGNETDETTSRFANAKGTWITVASLFAALIVGVTYATVIGLQPTTKLSGSDLGHAAQQWLETLDETEWRTISSDTDVDFPISPDVLSRPLRWQTVATSVDHKAIVFDMTPPGKRRILHFTLRTREEISIGNVMPAEPIYETATHCVGASRQGKEIFVLVVEGNRNRYRQVIRRQLPVI